MDNRKNIFNPEALIKKKSDVLFLLAGLFMLFVTAYIFFDSLSFLTSAVDTALDESNEEVTFQKFNLEGLQTLGILKTTPSPILTPSTSPSPDISVTP